MLLPLHLNVWAPIPGGGGVKAVYFSFKEDKIVCPPEAEEHCEKIEKHLDLVKIYDDRLKNLTNSLLDLQESVRVIPKRQFVRRITKKQNIVKRIEKTIELKRESENILEQEEEAIIALIFSEE